MMEVKWCCSGRGMEEEEGVAVSTTRKGRDLCPPPHLFRLSRGTVKQLILQSPLPPPALTHSFHLPEGVKGIIKPLFYMN